MVTDPNIPALPARPRPRIARGFTLLELLVALMLASLVMLMAAGAVRATLRGVGDTTVDRQRGAREDRTITLLTTQLAWMAVGPEGAPALFRGRANSLDVQTLCTLGAPHRRHPSTARWRIIQRADAQGVFDLFYEEASIRKSEDRPPEEIAQNPGRAPAETLAGDLDPKRARLILRGLREASFAYLLTTGAGGSDAQWGPEWSGPSLPRAMRVTITTSEGERKSWVLPVAVTF